MNGKHKQKLRIYSREEPQNEVSVVEVDGRVISERTRIAGVFDHHRHHAVGQFIVGRFPSCRNDSVFESKMQFTIE